MTVDFSEVDRMFKRITRVPKAELDKGLREMGKEVVKIEQHYPPSVGYPRTGRLRSGWREQLQGDTETIKNPVSYAGFVQGARQVAHHARHGWKKVQDVAEDVTQKGVDKLAKIWVDWINRQ